MKKTRILLTVCLVAVLASVCSSFAANNLVVHYNFDDQGNLIADSSGNGKDLSLYENNGTYSSDGVFGGSVDFNEATQGYRAIYTDVFPAGDFSFSTWVKIEGETSMIVQPFRTDGGFQVTVAAGTIRFWLQRSTGDGAAWDVINTTVAPTVGEWMHLAITFDTDGTTDEFGNYSGLWKCFINGNTVVNKTQLYHPTGFRGDTLGLCIGKRGAPASTIFNGKYDDFAIFDVALNNVEIQGLADGKCSAENAVGYLPENNIELVGYYSFDDSSNPAYDDSGNGLNLINDSTYQVPGYTSEGAVNGAAVLNGSTQGFLGSASLFPAGSFTVSFWAKPNVDATAQSLVRAFTNGQGYAITQMLTGEFRFYTYNTAVPNYSLVRSYFNGVADQWYHLAMTFDSDGVIDVDGNYTGTMRAFINGYQLGQPLANAQYNVNNPTYVCFGKRATDSFNGMLDEYAVFSGALSNEQVGMLALKEATPLDVQNYEPSPVTPIAYYGFNDPNEPSFGLKGDNSFNGKNLTLYDYDAAFSGDGITGGCANFNENFSASQANYEGYRAIYPDIFPDGDFTFATWINKTKASIAAETVIQTFNSSGGGFQVTIAANTYRFWTLYNGGYAAINTGVSPVLDTWVHLAMTYKAESGPDASGNYTGTFKNYINGVLVNETPNQLYHPQPANGLCLGRRATAYLVGKLDDVAIWNTALEDWQVFGLASSDYAPMSVPAFQVGTGDFNADGIVNLEDFSIMADNWFDSSY